MLIDTKLMPLLRAAEAGNAHALSELSERYLLGNGVPQNRNKAKIYLQKLVALENRDEDFASFELILLALADLYHADKNYKASLAYYQKAKDYILSSYPTQVAQEKIFKQKIDDEISRCIKG